MTKPAKHLADDAGAEGARRFRFTGLHQRLASAGSLPLPVPRADDNLDATTSHVATALADLTEQNLTAHFTAYATLVRPRTLSLPLILRGRAILVRQTCQALRDAALQQPEAVQPVALCAAALAHDLGPRYFAPHFHELVRACADACHADTLWDPELVLNPVFAALSSIAKILAKHLAGDPKNALEVLAPLLAHKHYRVRELAASNCLGYVLRKTRQDGPRDAMVKALVHVLDPPAAVSGNLQHAPAAHGAGAVLFEAMADPAPEPSGVLRPRAVAVLQTMLRESLAIVHAEDIAHRVVVAAHAVARLCIHAKSNADSTRQILKSLLDAAEQVVGEESAAKAAGALFLARNAVRVLRESPGAEPLLHKAATVATRAVENFPAHVHVVYEAFELFLVSVRNANHRRASRWVSALCKVLANVFEKLESTSIRNMLHLLTAGSLSANEMKNSPLMPVVKWFVESISSENGKHLHAEILEYRPFRLLKRWCDGVDVRLQDLVKSPIPGLVQRVLGGTASEDILCAINVQLGDDESALDSIEDADLERLLETLATNLSSTSSTVRKQSALLLYRISCARSTEKHTLEVSQEFSQDEAMLVRKQLGDALETHEECPDLLVYSAILIVSIAPFRLDFIPVIKEVLGRLARHAKRLSGNAKLALGNFCLGIFCMRFKPFWDGARELWGALAAADPGVAWKPMQTALAETRSEMLRFHAAQRENDDDDGGDEVQDINTVQTPKHKSKKRPRTCNPAHAEADSSKMRKSRKMQAIFVLLWNIDEWKSPSKKTQTNNHALNDNGHFVYDGTLETSCVDVLTRHLQYLNVLCEFPKSTLKMRPFIVDELYLALDPSLLSKKSGDKIVQQYGILMEKMGGLKISENDKQREQRLKTRLYRDLTRPCSAAQAEILRCICASRSPDVNRYKEELLRLIGDRTFREEVALLTEKLASDDRARLEPRDEDQIQFMLSDSVVDVLVRICYSKMRGNRQKFHSRRASAVSFACTSLPPQQSLPSLVALILQGFDKLIANVLGAELLLDLSKYESQLPDEKLCMGVLTSLDSLLCHGWNTIPEKEWTHIVTALVLVLAKSKSCFQAQLLRSDALGLLASMVQKRQEQSAFAIVPTLELVSGMDVTSAGVESVTGAPALLKLLSACFKSGNQNLLENIVRKHSDVCLWAVSIFSAQASSVNTVQLVTDVALGIIEIKKQENVEQVCGDIVNKLADAIRSRLRSLRDSADNEWYRVKSNRDTLQLVMKVLASIVTCTDMEREVLKSLVESLLFIVTETKLNGAALLSSIQALESVVQQLECQEVDESVESEVAPLLAPMLSDSAYAKQLDVKVAICKVMRRFKCLALQMTTMLILDTFATSARRLDEADLDARSEAFATLITLLKRAENSNTSAIEITTKDLQTSKSAVADPKVSSETDLSCQWGENAVLLVTHAALCAVEDDDVAVRGTASHTLHLLVKLLAKQGADTKFKLCVLLTNKAVSTPTLAARRELCKVLGNLVRSGQGNVEDQDGLFRSLSLISNVDLEADFFENVAHLQVHRRSRAMRRMAKRLVETSTEKEASSAMCEAVCRFLFPLSVRIALEMSKANEVVSRSSRRSKQSKLGYNRDVVNTAIALNHACAKFLPWQAYRREVSSVVRKIPRETEEERANVLYALLVGFADAFPGSKGSEDQDENRQKMHNSFLNSFLIPKLISFISCGSFEGEVHITANFAKKEKSGSEDRSLTARVFRAPVGIAAAKLVALLDEESLNTVIPTLVTPLSNALRSRMHDIRNEAKRVLVEVVTQLDPKYFAYIVDQVLSALSRGFRKETIIYVIQAILSGVRDFRNHGDEKRPFPIDNAVKKLCKAMVDELEDGLHASKTDYLNPNASTLRIKESAHRASKVAEVSQLLGELVDFSTSARLVLKPFTNVLNAATSSKLIARVSDVLNKAILGFSKNASLNALDALKLAFELVNENMPTPNMITGDDSEDSVHLRNKLQPLLEGRTFTNSPGSHVLCEMGWQLLSYLFSKGIIDAEGKQQQHREAQSKIAPFVPELLLSMRSRHDSLTRLSLKCAQRVMLLPMSSRRELADVMAATTVEVLSRNLGISANRIGASSGIGNDGLFNTCLRASAVLVQEIGLNEETGIRRERVVALLHIARNVLDQGSVEARSAALALIKSAISANITIPEVYDIAEFVSKLAIHSQSTALQSSCTAILVQFLIYFPLRRKRMRQHLDFLVRNLSYEFPHGRIAAINILIALCQQLPEKSLIFEAEYFFLSLAAVVGRDDNRECRKAAAVALRTIFSSLEDRRTFDSLLKMAQTFLTGAKSEANEDLDLLRTGCVTISAAAESGKLTREQQKMCVLKVTAATVKSLQLDWERLYSLLCCIERLYGAQGEIQMKDRMELQSEFKQLWESIPDLLLHQHEWVRLASSRLLGCHLAAAGGRDASIESPNPADLYNVLWVRDGTLRNIAKSLTLEFEAEPLSQDLAKQSLKNLLCITNLILKCPHAGDVAQVDQVDEEVRTGNRPLTWVIARVSGLSTRVGEGESTSLRRACGLRFLLQAIKWWGDEVLDGRLKSFVAPIVQILESKATIDQPGMNEKKEFGNNDASDEEEEEDTDVLTTLALTLQDALTESVGVTQYFEMYRELASKRRGSKIERKRKAAIEAVMDPERAAKKKQRKAEKKAIKRKANRNTDMADRVLYAGHKVFEDGERINLRE